MKYQILAKIFYIIYVILWSIILLFLLKNIQYGMFKPFVLHYGVFGTGICFFIGIVTLLSPVFLKYKIKFVWKVPLIAIILALAVFIIWFIMMFYAITEG